MCISLSVYMHTYVYIYMCVFACVQVYICVHVYVSFSVFKYISICLLRGCMCCILTSDSAKYAIPKTAEVAYSIGVGELGWQFGAGLKSHGTVTNRCTGREWPVNCMAVITARWRSDTPFQRRRKWIFLWPFMGRDWVSVELFYNSVHRKFNQFGDQKSWRNDAVEKTSTQRGWASRPPVEQLRRTGKKRGYDQ